MWEFDPYPGQLEVGRPSVSLAPQAGFKYQREDQGEVDEEGDYLYNHIKMLYEDDFCPEPMLTQGMEDAIALVSELSSSTARLSLPPTVLSPS